MVIKLQKNKKNKILFWIDLGVTHFGIAKFLQKEYDLFAIYDVNPNQKKEFIITKFQKQIRSFMKILILLKKYH